MRHRVAGKKLGRNTKQRKALYKGLIGELITNGQIITTVSKAKVIARLTDKLVTKAKKQDLNSRRIIAAFFNKKQVTNKLVDELVPHMNSRISGYTRITRVGRRIGDDAMSAKIEFVDRKAPAITPAKDSKEAGHKSKATNKSKKKTTGVVRTTPKVDTKIHATNVMPKASVQRTTSK